MAVPSARSARALAGWAFVAAAALAVLGSRGVSPAGAQDRGLTPQERSAAALIYTQQCAQCHGAAGQGATVPGTDRQAPALAGRDEVTVAFMDLVLRVGRMPPPASPFDNRGRRVALSDEQREILVAWTAERFDLDGQVPDPVPGDAGRGQEVWTQHCAHCHGATGAGGVAGAGAWTPAVSNKDPVAIAEAIRVGPFEMPRFDERQVSDEEIGDIIAFMDVAEHEQGTLLGVAELNPVFASAFVATLAVIVLLSLLWISGRPAWFPDPEKPHDDHGDGTDPGDDHGDGTDQGKEGA